MWTPEPLSGSPPTFPEGKGGPEATQTWKSHAEIKWQSMLSGDQVEPSILSAQCDVNTSQFLSHIGAHLEDMSGSGLLKVAPYVGGLGGANFISQPISSRDKKRTEEGGSLLSGVQSGELKQETI